MQATVNEIVPYMHFPLPVAVFKSPNTPIRVTDDSICGNTDVSLILLDQNVQSHVWLDAAQVPLVSRQPH